MKVLTEERQQIILQQLKIHNIVKLHDLIPLTGASASTLRRDLKDLESCHKLLRIHGGAQNVISLHEEPALSQKATVNLDGKKAIGKAAANLVQNNEVIFLDSGTTIQFMIPYLIEHKDLLVVTNSVDNASMLADYNIDTFLPGGRLKSATKALVGSTMIQTLETYHFDKAFIGANGFSIDSGFTTPDPEESAIKNLAITQSNLAFVLSDSSKYCQVSFSKFADIKDVTLITSGLTDKELELLNKKTRIMEVN
ncbi:DeoR/GlpR family DNA-binding transcription regulator [Companilactobacillus tucceti]|uniref:DeoR/GlpR family DNA-binding transcription regulator n=1 Tax=Companilactobacillus tucceti TaxID=238012 RepID=UPI001F43628D|nr:DeoR/GlpR family DNA-binding transcription regulator [Companilactobacillus tucceti]